MAKKQMYLVSLWRWIKQAWEEKSGEREKRTNNRLKTRSEKGESVGQVAEVRWTRKGWKEHNNRDERLPENWKRLKRDKRWSGEGGSNEWRENEKYERPNKTKKKRKETKIDWGKLKKWETFAGSLSVNHNLLGVGYERERECNFAVVMIIITAIIIIRVIPVRGDGKADGKGWWRRIKCQIGGTRTLPGVTMVKCTETVTQ